RSVRDGVKTPSRTLRALIEPGGFGVNDPYQTVPSAIGRADAAAGKLTPRIGRYRVERILGRGGFGVVYLADDEQLQRKVAIKVPHTALLARAEDAALYLAEARSVARLDHPNIVPVHDVGSTEQLPCYIVSKYID